MSPLSVSQVEERVRGHLNEEVRVAPSGREGNRVGCVMPLEYPNGDNVVVWVVSREPMLQITDLGEAAASLFERPPQDLATVEELAETLCRYQGVQYVRRQIGIESGPAGVGEAVWRVASASAQVAQAIEHFRPRRRERREFEFVRELEQMFERRDIPIRREHKLEGRSGHQHRATLYLPDTHTVLEPLNAWHWNKISAIYTKFGDLQHANGYRLFSVVDDREQLPDEEGERVLTQVSRVVEWSRHTEWIDAVRA